MSDKSFRRSTSQTLGNCAAVWAAVVETIVAGSVEEMQLPEPQAVADGPTGTAFLATRVLMLFLHMFSIFTAKNTGLRLL